MIKRNKNYGFSLIEVLIACAIISMVIFAFISTATKNIKISAQSLKQTQANMLLEEGVEAVKSVRDDGWSNISGLTLNTNYYLFFNNSTNKWILSTNSSLGGGYIPVYPIDSIFTRSVRFEEVERDSTTDDISNSGSTYIDSGTKKVSVTVSFNSSGEEISRSVDFYVANIFE